MTPSELLNLDLDRRTDRASCHRRQRVRRRDRGWFRGRVHARARGSWLRSIHAIGLVTAMLLTTVDASSVAAQVAAAAQTTSANEDQVHVRIAWLAELEQLRRDAGHVLAPLASENDGPIITGRVVNQDGDPVRAHLQIIFVPSTNSANARRHQVFESVRTDDQGAFSYQAPAAGRLIIRGTVNEERIMHNVNDVESDTDDVEIVVNAPAIGSETDPEYISRRVAIKVRPPAGYPRVEGNIRLQVLHGDGNWEMPTIQLVHGRAIVHVRGGPQAERMHVRVAALEANGLTVDPNQRQQQFPIPAGEGPVAFEFYPIPAGAIHGRILDETGAPVANATILPMTSSRARGAVRFQGMATPHGQLQTNEAGWFLVYPVPLDTVAHLVVQCNDGTQRRAVSAVETISFENPIAIADLVLPQGLDIPLRLRDYEGEPLPETSINLSWQTNRGMPLGVSQLTTDANGEVVLEGVNPELNAQVTALVAPGEHHPGIQTSIRLIEEPIELELPQGMVIRGVVLDALTGDPVPDATIDAYPRRRSGQPQLQNTRVETQDDGSFEFNNLADSSYTLRVQNHWPEGTVRLDRGNGRFSYRSNTSYPQIESGESHQAPSVKLHVLLAEDVPIDKPEAVQQRQRAQAMANEQAQALQAARVVEAQRAQRLQNARVVAD